MSWRFPDQLGGGQEGQQKCQTSWSGGQEAWSGSHEAWSGGQEALLGGQEAWSGGQEARSGGLEVQTEPDKPPASHKVVRRHTWP